MSNASYVAKTNAAKASAPNLMNNKKHKKSPLNG